MEAAKFILQGRVVETKADDEKDIEVYYNPGWVTNTLDERGIWIGNGDLDGILKNLRVVAQVVYPQGARLEVSAGDIRSRVVGIMDQLEEGLFIMDKGYANDENILPFLHVSLVILPAGDVYAITCTTRLLEDVDLKRDSWAKDFTWQAITWEKEKLFVSREEQIGFDIQNALTIMLEDFVDQYLSDKKTREEITDEEKSILKEIDEDFERLKQGD